MSTAHLRSPLSGALYDDNLCIRPTRLIRSTRAHTPAQTTEVYHKLPTTIRPTKPMTVVASGIARVAAGLSTIVWSRTRAARSAVPVIAAAMSRGVALLVVAIFVATTAALLVVDVAMRWGALLSPYFLKTEATSLSVGGGDTGERAAAAVIEAVKMVVVVTNSGRETLSQRPMSWPVVALIGMWRFVIYFGGGASQAPRHPSREPAFSGPARSLSIGQRPRDCSVAECQGDNCHGAHDGRDPSLCRTCPIARMTNRPGRRRSPLFWQWLPLVLASPAPLFIHYTMSSFRLHRLPCDAKRRLWRRRQAPARRLRLCQGPRLHLCRHEPPLYHGHLRRADCVGPRARGGIGRNRHLGRFDAVAHGCGRPVGGAVSACQRAVAGGSGVAGCGVAGSGIALAGALRVIDAWSGRGVPRAMKCGKTIDGICLSRRMW